MLNSDKLKARKKIALNIADQCINLLKNDYGAIEVILFGSLRGDSPWHWDSDLDLAVSGLSDQEMFEAYGKLETVLPSWLTIDLISLEKTTPKIRSRILGKEIMSDDKYSNLKSRIEDELASIERNLERLTLVLQQVDSIPEVALSPALASYINDFYKGCERISEAVAVTIDGDLPQGKNWHQLLLRQVANSNQNRPAVWSHSLFLDLDEYRKFRHLVLHTYNIDLDGKRVQELAVNLESVFARIKEDVMKFNSWLVEANY